MMSPLDSLIGQLTYEKANYGTLFLGTKDEEIQYDVKKIVEHLDSAIQKLTKKRDEILR